MMIRTWLLILCVLIAAIATSHWLAMRGEPSSAWLWGIEGHE